MLSKIKKPYRSLAFMLGILVIFFAAVFMAAVSVQAAEQSTQVPQKVPGPQAPAAIPLAEVATKATEVSNLLRNMSTQFAPSHETETIGRQLQEGSVQIDLELSETMKVLRAQPTLQMLQNEQQLWQKRELEMTGWLNLVTQRAAKLQEALNLLTDLRKTWSQTRDAAKVSKAPGPSMQQIDGTLVAIEAAQTPLQVQRTTVLDLQSRVAQEVTWCETALAQVSQAQQKAVGGLLKRDSLPIWNARLWIQVQDIGAARIREIAAGHGADIQQYFRDPSKGMLIHVALFVVLAVLLCAMRRQVHLWSAAGEGSPLATSVFDRPFASALLAALFAVSSPNIFPASPTLRQLFTVLELAPMIRLVQPVVDPRMVNGLWALGFLFALNTIRDAFAGVFLFERAIILLEIIVGMVALGWCACCAIQIQGRIHRC